MADCSLYINNFRGRAGRTEQAKHLVAEFDAIEAAFTCLQAINTSTYLTIYVNTTALSGTITIIPDNGYLQELTLTEDTAISVAPPSNESRYRMSLLIHGGGYKVTNLWGAQTWKEYGLGNWWELYTGDGPFASMLLDFFWDRCSHTWICVASSRNQFHLYEAGVETRLYPLLSDLTNVDGDDTLGFTRASDGLNYGHNGAHHYHPDDEPRFTGVRHIDNWCATPSDLTSVGWVATDVTVTTDAGEGPTGGDVNRLSFDVTGGKVACFVLPSFGRSSTSSDSIKVAVSFKGRTVAGTEDVRVYCSFMGKTGLDVHDVVQVGLDAQWQQYGAVLDVTKDGNSNSSLILGGDSPKTLMEIAFASPSGSAGSDIQITEVMVEVLRGTDEETISPEVQNGTIGASMVLTATGTGTWVDGTKTLTLAVIGQYVDFGGNLEIGKSYLVHPRLTSGGAADIRMQNEVTVWAAGSPSDDLYLQDAPFVFQYEGGILKFVLTEGSSAVYSLDIYEMTGNTAISKYRNLTVVTEGGVLVGAIADPPIPLHSKSLRGVVREAASANAVTFSAFRSFSTWDAVGLTGEAFNYCANPVLQSEYGIDAWPSRGTLMQGASAITDGYIQRDFTVPADNNAHDFGLWVGKSLNFVKNVGQDPIEGFPVYEGSTILEQTIFPQGNDIDITVPLSRYIDFEVELTGGATEVTAGRIRMDIAFGYIISTDRYLMAPPFNIQVHKVGGWYHVVITIKNNGLNDNLRVRVHPASTQAKSTVGPNVDPSEVDPTATGWVIIDWAQLEDSVGNLYEGESVNTPIVGGETRAVEDFTSALSDGDYYRSQGMEHVAALTANNVIWDVPDGIYRNLLFSNTVMIPDIIARNMHEFGLVETTVTPDPTLTIATTTLYPIEVDDSVQLGADITYGEMSLVQGEDYDQSGALLGITLEQILIDYGPDDQPYDQSGDLLGITLQQILIDYGPDNQDYDQSSDLLAISIESKLVIVDTPDERLQVDCDLNPSGCSLTPV